MGSYERAEVYRRMADDGVVPLFHHADPEVATTVLDGVVRGGGRVLEFTARGESAAEVFSHLRAHLRDGGLDCALGVGSVVDAPTAALYLSMGAAFVVGPSFEPAVAQVCNRRKVAYIPGCATATEVGRAEEAGAEIVKLFPGEVLGPSFLRALLGPSPWTRAMVTGGVTATRESFSQWFGAGAVCVGLGSALLSRDMIEGADPAPIARAIGQALALAADVRST